MRISHFIHIGRWQSEVLKICSQIGEHTRIVGRNRKILWRLEPSSYGLQKSFVEGNFKKNSSRVLFIKKKAIEKEDLLKARICLAPKPTDDDAENHSDFEDFLTLEPAEIEIIDEGKDGKIDVEDDDLDWEDSDMKDDLDLNDESEDDDLFDDFENLYQ